VNANAGEANRKLPQMGGPASVQVDEVVLLKRRLDEQCVQRASGDVLPCRLRQVNARAGKRVDVHVAA
jgi:hypothetical protein